ncbi:S-layer homology domain-containing protein [Butyricicoccus sp. AM78-15b2TA]|uniref:S-layer homology domain-containing protein n=1 Tax=Butyricicoccus sp. AM78-15b2TA TaxID=3002516 RepID=UPI0022DFB945|nr:S-layer homology domain-containing protein [Butyricicoccus sp. AM78-15b2TA]
MKKRILSILLTLCMVLCLVPITVFAAGGAKAILPGTSAQSILKIDKSRLSFAGHEWWVIGQKTDKSNNAPIITLLAVNNDFGDVPFRTGSAVPFENASRYSEDNGYYANNPSDMSQWRKPNEYAGSTLQQKMVSLAEAIPEKEQAVIRPKDITEGITGQEVKAQKLWALSHEDSIFLYRNSCTYAAKWWTRSSNEVYGYGSWTIHPDGKSGSALNVDYDAAVRPAMELDLSSVLFISAAEHGKVADLTTPIAEYAGDEWKLTLHDSDRDDFTAKTVLVNGSVLEVEYKNAKVGDNEYISAVIKDADGSISRYTRVVQLDGTTNGTRGRAAIDLTGIDMTGKTLCVFNEQFNGNHKTDYAGALREVKLTDEIDEQFTLAPGGRYYFDLSAMGIPGTVNDALPDNTLHYVPFTYAGTVDAYKLTSAMATTEEYAQQNKYSHSLFVADYAVTHKVNWNNLDTASLIFGKDYASGGVDYTLRAPSVGSNFTGSGNSQRGVPQSNEWDKILDKDSGYIKNWSEISSWGQDTKPDNSFPIRANRGDHTARDWGSLDATYSYPSSGFRPVLEVLNSDTLGSDGLKVVTLDLGGGTLGNSSEAIQIIVKNGSKFTAPASDGLNRPDGNNGSYFKWLGSDGNLYAPGESVPEVVTTLTAQWTVNQYTITYNLVGGTVEGNPNTYTIGTVAFTLKNPIKSGYTFTGWSGTGLDGENNMTVTIPTGSTGNRIYTAHWRYNGSGHSYSYYTIKATAGAGGSISPSGNVSVREGRDQTFTITPDKGYAVANVKIDGKSIGAVKSYTFENVRRTHTIEVIFMKANGNPQTGVFVDVATGSYYEDAVDWAVENGITKGTDDTHFSPDGICTRAQAVTFLWRAAGSPKPETRTMPFTDVPVGSYYYDAVLWAVENGITKGTSDTTFSPNITCTRAQIVAFLWRSEKSPAAGTANPFADVKSTAYYADAVLWAVKENITKGTTSTTFGPNADCTRAQIVTFLWRCKK